MSVVYILLHLQQNLKLTHLHSVLKFKEDTRIKVDFVIEGKLTTYAYDTVIGKEGTVEKGFFR